MAALFLRYFILGILISYPFHSFIVSARKKIPKMQFEDKVGIATIVQILGLVIIVAGFVFSIYGNYLTALAGEGTMNPADFKALADQFNEWFYWYMAFLWTLVGIATGIGLILIFKRIWFYFRQGKNKQHTQDDFEITISTKEMDSILARTKEISKLGTRINTFTKQLKDGDEPNGKPEGTQSQDKESNGEKHE